jgi:mono/diheme cytochrome c family protein
MLRSSVRWQWLVVLAVAGCGGMPQATSTAADPNYDQVEHGRRMVLQHACGDCHGGGNNPAADGFLQGAQATDTFMVGPLKTFPRNLTPDSATGIGRYTERQIFNALRYGLRPSATPDVEITARVPGQGNFPAQPKYLAPSMPWAAWRYMTDEELRAIAAYLKRGLRPVSHKVTDSDAPPDNWASEVTVEKIGQYPPPPYPTAQEVALTSLPAGTQQKIMRGRYLVISHACGGCHSSVAEPSKPDWLGGVTKPEQEFQIGPFKTRPRNLTPDNTTGMGRFTERQIFNALRFGLRPGETPDVEITATTPGMGNYPNNPKYLAPPMPWPSWRHMPDEDLWAMAAYLKHAVKPLRNRVADSEGPPDFWASGYTVDKIGPHPALPFPTKNEVASR